MSPLAPLYALGILVGTPLAITIIGLAAGTFLRVLVWY